MSLHIQYIDTEISKVHKQIIADLISANPQSPLTEICEKLDEMIEMANCHIDLTPEVLMALGHHDPGNSTLEALLEPLSPIETESAQTPTGSTPIGEGGAPTLSVDILRRQLEGRHANYTNLIDGFLGSGEDSLTDKKLKVVEVLAKLDDKVTQQLLDLMSRESTPLLPLAIIIMCLRKHGVPESEIKIINDSID
jgi:hypothetical protein